MGTAADRSASETWVKEHGWICPGSEMFLQYHQDRVDVVRKVPLFSQLDPHHLDRIAGSVGEKRAETGAMLAHQGRRERDFLLILDGAARVERDGKVLAHLKTGDFFGEMSLVDGAPRSATVIADSPCVLLVIDRRPFRKLLDSDPKLETKILATLCQRLRDADAALAAVN